jgi:hypothetical protein
MAEKKQNQTDKQWHTYKTKTAYLFHLIINIILPKDRQIYDNVRADVLFIQQKF